MGELPRFGGAPGDAAGVAKIRETGYPARQPRLGGERRRARGCTAVCSRDPPRPATAIKVIHRAIDQGVTFIDTAASYGRGESDMDHNERLFRTALA